MAADSPRARRSWLQEHVERLRRSIDPSAAEDREALRDLTREVRDWRNDDDRAAREQLERMRAMESRVDAVSRDTAAQYRQLTRVRHLFAKQRDMMARIVRRTALDHAAIEAEQRVTGRLARLARSRLPIVVGPWTGEVGYELIYWIPFLQWMRAAFAIDPDRLIVVSRGGVASWYTHVSSNYEDVFTRVTPADFLAATKERKKQQQIRPFDRSVIKSVLRERGIRRAHVLHPTLMYSLFKAFWRYTATVKTIESYSRFRRLPIADNASAPALSLPNSFVAVRFYFSDCFPDTDDNRRFAARVIDGLTARGNVVLLNNDLVVDDHSDFTPANRSRVHLLGAGRPETNLAIQTEAISRATAFVGTYGGYSYLAPLCGVSSVAFYSRSTFKQHHLELAQRAFLRLGSARLVPVDVGRAEILGAALAGIVSTPIGA